MSKNYGTGVSRVLDVSQSQYTNIIFQQGKPPIDSEISALADVSQEGQRAIVARGSPSGWLGSGIQDHDSYLTHPAWSNWFRFGQQRTGEMKAIEWASVNGWLIPVTGTGTRAVTSPGVANDEATWNCVTLPPPPSSAGGGRVDFVFLEVWQARLSPNSSGLNKPSSSGVYRYGNVEGGYAYLPDDMVDPALGFETTQRIQIQYRIRVVAGLVGLQSFPDGFDPGNVRGRGAAEAETGLKFTNMRAALGDPGLWRAGDGTGNALGTVDGYTYAIPMCAVFRRNSVPWDGDPGQNLNGAFNRNPTATDRDGATTFFVAAALNANMTATQTTLTLASATNIALPRGPGAAALIKVGDEIMSYDAITGVNVTVARAKLGTRAEPHRAGTVVTVISGRPDGLFADQIAKTDILDLRHVVNPNGFDYKALLDGAVDQLLRGELRANWKRAGGGPQGPFVTYQDKISTSPPALGVSKLDGPDGKRQVWSDASYVQPFEFIALPGAPVANSIGAVWGLDLTATRTTAAPNVFSPGDMITIPISQFKLTAGSDADQVQFPAILAAAHPVVKIRIAGDAADLLVTTDFSVSTPTGPNSDLVITLAPTFHGGTTVNVALFITFHVQYGAGRGMSRKADCVHNLTYLSSSTGTLLRRRGLPSNSIPLSCGWAPLWSKFRRDIFAGQVPVTAESYVDPGSKTVVLSPFRQIRLPPSGFRARKGAGLHDGLGVMPNPSGKWGAKTDPLGLFSTAFDDAAKQHSYVVIPRNLMPGWGAVHVPIIHTDNGTVLEGINFGFNAPKGVVNDSSKSIIPFFGGSKSFATFSTAVLNTATANSTGTAAPYNAIQETVQEAAAAGMRFFDDARGLGRQGLELPPFYGIARLFAVYEARDFFLRGSAYASATRDSAEAAPENATNLLRQDLGNEPAFWIEIDSDGDSTFILNAKAIDLSRSPNPIASFTAAHYVIESSIFGFDRGAFDLNQDCRIVLAREREHALAPAGSGDGPVGPALPTGDTIMIIPAPPATSDSVAVNYSRTPYQGDAWGSQNSQQDIGHLVGPLTSNDANLIGFREVDELNPNRPNQKALQVLASKGFMTTFGTGRIAGDFSSSTGAVDFRSAGYENLGATTYPPSNPLSIRPAQLYGALSSADDTFALGTGYHGCIEQLPLGALFRSKDFRGESIDSSAGAVGLLFRDPSLGQLTNVAAVNVLEQDAVPVFTATAGSGGPGQVLVQVDGESGNMSTLTTYRTTRGGSAFVASGPFPGGELAGAFARLSASPTGNATLCCIAYLVRNTVTNIGSTEASAGSELMLLIVTTAIRKHPTNVVPAMVLCGTQGSGEGYSAADLYRITGRPLTNTPGVILFEQVEVNGERLNLDLSAIKFGHKISLKPKAGS